jgi:predicted transcriptional regulator
VKVISAELMMEVGSETPGYNNDFPSDITVWINGIDIGCWCSPGDMGGHRGRLNPSWWADNFNQFGFLKSWIVDQTGAYVDGVQVSTVTIDDLNIHPYEPTVVRIGVKPDAEHVGGLTLFGRGFGNYDQDLVLRLHHSGRSLP